MRGRRRAIGRRGGRRSVAWIPGYSTMDPATGASAITQALAPVPGSANTYGFGVGLVVQADLSMHGGEDAVLVRVLGKLWFYNQQTATAGPAPAWARVFFNIVNTTGNAQLVREYVSGASLGYDDVMATYTTWVPGDLNMLAAVSPLSRGTEFCINVDIKAKRKLQADRLFFMQYQCTSPAVPTNVQIAGHLRMLVMRPR